MRLAAFTIADPPFVARARVLARTWAEHHDVPLRLYHLGGAPLGEGDWEAVPAADIAPAGWLERILACWGGWAATALKPLGLLRALGEGADAAIFLDADTRVYAPLDGLAEAARAAGGIALTPHLLGRARADLEHIVRMAGTFNAGVVAAAPGAEPHLRWWLAAIARDVRMAPQDGQVVDQRYLDQLAVDAGASVVRDPGVNVLWTRLLDADLTLRDGRPHVGGAPLRLLHTGGGFDPRTPWVLGQGLDQGLAVDERPVLGGLLAAYAAELLDAGHEAVARLPHAGDRMGDGTPIDPAMRRLYREALAAASLAGAPEPPCPLGPDGGEGFRAWLREPADLRRHAVRSSRYLLALRDDDPGLAAASPYPPDDAGGVLRAAALARTPAPRGDLLDTGVEPARPAVALRPGTLVVTDAHPGPAAWGLSGWASRLARMASGDTTTLAWESRDRHRNDGRAIAALRHETVIAVVEPAAFAAYDYDAGSLLRPGRRAVAWCAGAGDLPAAGPDVEEVWCTSEHAAARLRRGLGARVRVVPVPAAPPATAPAPPLPDGPCAVAVLDLAGDVAGQAPEDALAAFAAARRRAGRGSLALVCLVAGALAERARVRHLAAEVPGAHVVAVPGDDPAAAAAAVARAAVLLDLSHSGASAEAAGWALAAGVPVVAGHLGALAELLELAGERGVAAAPDGARAGWAVPDRDEAATRLAGLLADPRPAGAARERLAAERSAARCAERMREALAALPHPG